MTKHTITEGSLALQENQCRVITIPATEQSGSIALRVAAYARVSSNSEDQENSFAAQYRYYTSLISGTKEWEMVDIYADEGITGTSADKRGDFQRLMADCRRGLIDRVLVKSISRFARNTLECLEVIRELKSIGVSVFFEEQNMDTSVMSSEMLTAIHATFAQRESENISKHIRWSYEKRMQNGEFNTCKPPHGFCQNGSNIIVERSETEVIQYIFSEYLSGKTAGIIAKELNECFNTERKWVPCAIDYILKNERYAGNALLQKKYTTDTFPHEHKVNHGERPMYYVEGINEPIISQDVFDRAQILRKSRAARYAKPSSDIKYLRKKVYCGSCDSIFRHKTINGKRYWMCNRHDEDAGACSVKPILEDHLYSSFLCLYYNLKHQGVMILTQLIANLQIIRERRMLWREDIVEINKQISELLSQNQLLAELNEHGLVDPDIFIAQTNELAQQLRGLKLQKERLMSCAADDTIPRTQDLIHTLEEGPDFLEAFDAELFSELIEKVIVEDNEHIRFRLKNGLELPETIERTVR